MLKKSRARVGIIIFILTATLLFAQKSSASDSNNFQDKLDAFRKETSVDGISTSKNTSEIKLDRHKEIRQVLENYKPSENNGLKKVSEKTASGRTTQGISSNLLLNSGFESGHVSWKEYDASSGSPVPSSNIILNIPGSAANGVWLAYLYPTDWLVSNTFTLPTNSTYITLGYNGNFYHTGTCTTGSNYIGTVLYDVTTSEALETITLHNANIEVSDSDYWYYSATSTIDLSGRGGHSMYISFLGRNSQSSCTVRLLLDDVSLTATTGTTPTSSIYRFWSDAKQGHFFTISAAEKDSIIANDHSWTYEGVAYSAFPTATVGTTPIYRFWSNSKQHHFFTASATEKDSIIANDHSWAYEGIAYYAYATEQPSSTAVYRFWSNSKQGHFFTISAAEKNSIIANDHSWNYEGIAWYVPL